MQLSQPEGARFDQIELNDLKFNKLPQLIQRIDEREQVEFLLVALSNRQLRQLDEQVFEFFEDCLHHWGLQELCFRCSEQMIAELVVGTRIMRLFDRKMIQSQQASPSVSTVD